MSEASILLGPARRLRVEEVSMIRVEIQAGLPEVVDVPEGRVVEIVDYRYETHEKIRWIFEGTDWGVVLKREHRRCLDDYEWQYEETPCHAS